MIKPTTSKLPMNSYEFKHSSEEDQEEEIDRRIEEIKSRGNRSVDYANIFLENYLVQLIDLGLEARQVTYDPFYLRGTIAYNLTKICPPIDNEYYWDTGLIELHNSLDKIKNKYNITNEVLCFNITIVQDEYTYFGPHYVKSGKYATPIYDYHIRPEIKKALQNFHNSFLSVYHKYYTKSEKRQLIREDISFNYP